MIPIDHCLTSPDLVVVNRHVTDSLGSDHLGIVVDLSCDWEDPSAAAGEASRGRAP